MDGVPILIRKGTFKQGILRMEKLFENEKETRRAIKAAVDKYNEIYGNHTVVKHQRSRHTKSKTQAQRKLRRDR